jgi:hypothetical protein
MYSVVNEQTGVPKGGDRQNGPPNESGVKVVPAMLGQHIATRRTATIRKILFNGNPPYPKFGIFRV